MIIYLAAYSIDETLYSRHRCVLQNRKNNSIINCNSTLSRWNNTLATICVFLTSTPLLKVKLISTNYLTHFVILTDIFFLNLVPPILISYKHYKNIFDDLLELLITFCIISLWKFAFEENWYFCSSSCCILTQCDRLDGALSFFIILFITYRRLDNVSTQIVDHFLNWAEWMFKYILEPV